MITRHALILAGGLGTRLGALTADCPKPLLPVARVPFLAHLIGHLAHEGMTRVTVLAGYRGQDIAAHFDSNPIPGIEIRVLIEPEPLGTGGALRFAAAHLPESFFLLNGDTFFDVSLADLGWNRDEPAPLARIALRQMEDTERYGVVLRDGTRITDFAARPAAAGQGGQVNGGIYWLRREILDHIGEGFVSLELDVFPALVGQGGVQGIAYSGAFIDIGVPDDYARAQEFLPKVLQRPALFLDRDGVINEDIGHLHEIEKFTWMPGAQAAIKRASDLGWFVFVVTNQGGVGRGFYDEATVKNLHHWLADQVFSMGGRITDIRYCPHHPEGVAPGYVRDCPWRKPNPGMILDLMVHHPVDRTASLMVGDRDTDMAAAKSAGIRGVKFDGGRLDDLLTPYLTERGSS